MEVQNLSCFLDFLLQNLIADMGCEKKKHKDLDYAG